MPVGATAAEWEKISSKEPENSIKNVMLPMVSQEEFDQYLWACDSLIIRGEDSFVRAQLAGKPFIWNIYPQTENTHIKKLHAFSSRIKPFYQEEWCLWNEANIAWNKEPENLYRIWHSWREQTEALTKKAVIWKANLESIGSLSKNLCKFIELKLKLRA